MNNNNKTDIDEKTSTDYEPYSDVGGIVNLRIDLRIPKSYLDAVKAVCNLDNTPVRLWFNNEILNLIESIEVGYTTRSFIERFHLKGLSREKKDALMHAHTAYTMVEEKLSDE